MSFLGNTKQKQGLPPTNPLITHSQSSPSFAEVRPQHQAIVTWRAGSFIELYRNSAANMLILNIPHVTMKFGQ